MANEAVGHLNEAVAALETAQVVNNEILQMWALVDLSEVALSDPDPTENLGLLRRFPIGQLQRIGTTTERLPIVSDHLSVTCRFSGGLELGGDGQEVARPQRVYIGDLMLDFTRAVESLA